MSRTEQFKKFVPSALKNGAAGAFGDYFVVNQVKEQRKGAKFADSYTSAHGIKAMYLCPNKHTANGHYLYNWVTWRVITRSSLKRVAGIPDGWNKSNVVVPEVIDEDGNIFDFINGPSEYDVHHLGATIQAITA
jgi:hypothetical protein